MKYSIKRQMMTVFVGLILFMIVVFMIVNGSFLEKYYISNTMLKIAPVEIPLIAPPVTEP